MADTGDGLESKDLQTMISDRNETAEMMVKRVWPRVDSWKVQWSKKLTSMRFKVRWHDDSPKGTITLSEAQWAKCRKHVPMDHDLDGVGRRAAHDEQDGHRLHVPLEDEGQEQVLPCGEGGSRRRHAQSFRCEVRECSPARRGLQLEDAAAGYGGAVLARLQGQERAV